LLTSGNARAQTVQNDRYPNELPGYRFYATASWKSLEPLISTAADVRRVLGKPTNEVDLSQYFAPYPEMTVQRTRSSRTTLTMVGKLSFTWVTLAFRVFLAVRRDAYARLN